MPVLLLGLTLLVARAAAAHDPKFDDVDFRPLGCIGDEPAADATPPAVDLVGTATRPAAQTGHDARYLYVRLRVDGNPGAPDGFAPFAWVVLLQASDGDPKQYRHALALNGADDDFGTPGDTVELWHNVDAAADFSLVEDPAEQRLWARRWNHATNATPNEGPLARHTPTGDGDFFVDVAVPAAVLVEHGVVASADALGGLRLFAATATASNRYDRDTIACPECTADLDCADGNGCTTDTCEAGACRSVQTDPACVPCATAEACDDEDPCTDDTCGQAGVCEHVPREGCVPCATSEDCTDGDPCTADACGEDGSCIFTTIPGCVRCEADEDCADADECTEDTCFMGACANVPIPDCVPCTPVAEVCGDGQDNDCDELVDCDDPNCAASPQCAGEPEICGNCEDDDDDGFVDLDDPDCCALSQSIPMRWLRIKTRTVILRKRMRVKARYLPALPAENFDPTTQDTTFQLSDEQGHVFCATLPAAKWRLRDTKRTIYRFKDKYREVANGLHVAVYREKPKGQVIFRTRGKKIDLSIRDFRGDVRATVRLGDQCSVAAGELREGRNKIVYP